MCIILGIIFNNEVVIASKYRLGILDNEMPEERIQITSYNLEPEIFHVVLAGEGAEMQQFDLKLASTNFIGPSVSVDLFVTTCYKIIKQQRLSGISVLIVGFDKRPVLNLITGRGIETEWRERSYLLLPDFYSSAGNCICNQHESNMEVFSSKEDILIFIHGIFEKLCAKSEVPITGMDLNYAFISENNKKVDMKTYKGG